ncbi:FAD-dependent thymidylate synthase [Rhodococcus sp. NPDC003994]
MTAELNAQLVGFTVFAPPVDTDGKPIFQPEEENGVYDDGVGTDVLFDGSALAEFAGRVCYQSFDRPNPATANNDTYLLNILRQKHGSVLEHATASFYITGVSRALTHELIRHRHLSYSQLSQRYVDSTGVDFVMPPILHPSYTAGLESAGRDLAAVYGQLEKVLAARGASKKRAREAARAVLPNMTETRLVVTGNYRAWIEFLVKRDNPAADLEIQQLAIRIGEQLAVHQPHIFGAAARAEWHDGVRQAAPHAEQPAVTA